MKRFVMLGVSHKYAPLELRERVAYADRRIPAALRTLREQCGCDEAVIISTCNRVEVYAFCAADDAREKLLNQVAADHNLKPDFLANYVYFMRGREAVEHLIRVCGGLDSLVVGETQIINQAKKAFLIAQSENATGKSLNALFLRAFSVAKRLHSETGISEGQFSISSVAVGFARRLFESLSDKTALLIGAGEVGELTLNYLKEEGIGRAIVVSRTIETARDTASRYGADAVPMELLADYLPAADIVITQAASEHPILGKNEFRAALKRRSHRSMFVLDLGVPRNVAADVNNVEDVYLYNVDHLEQVVAEHTQARSNELERCSRIVTQEVDSFLEHFQGFSAGPLIETLTKRAQAVKSAELERVSARLAGLDEDGKRELEAFADRLTNKLLHTQINGLKQESRRADAAESLRVLSRALGLEDDAAQTAAQPAEAPSPPPLTEKQP
ncbi:MAG: glutamyl-tRNA reductase [Planctomycetes bacterium]|nr:glutamyl-tRNA reductase [Planctomycetota bacterium]